MLKDDDRYYPNDGIPQGKVEGKEPPILDCIQIFLNNSTFFKGLIGFIIFLNPLALTPQVWMALTAPSIAGLSLFMWIMFAFIQVAIALEGLRNRSSVTFWAMAISAIESFIIIAAILIRG